jgi:glycerol-3-phosphate dehydrogenase
VNANCESVGLLIVGGGSNVTGIARDAAGRGLKVALVERSDLGSATSSASTKLIHAGLRYLESFSFQRMRESMLERERLPTMAPHIVRPLEFVLPHAPGLRPRWQISLGLLLYDSIASRRRVDDKSHIRLVKGSHIVVPRLFTGAHAYLLQNTERKPNLNTS